ncbi:3-hydroxyacyl-CoA dehydrogenase family protein [Aureibacter tunicatorum]|uniref:3-hydroxybutyryl-CoA dehydrogenase n=1 Tax=Aureibacter tunicatorum TaxID=866807 RepID=A0AAE3XMT2_9BACT|nr:3-hydroxyacyl-CoA dehydrogenase NAD-binding domain-containing protein [Aureibacter tunicatorum]MDR6239375.1 3-hydroxybutyryl-CoA dehydrogenase [Aureibacter tunicatorum]BDD04702.1 3-hydroxybutyryl-CoA dehydrogenase [Aureibacter tunicatorum]
MSEIVESIEGYGLKINNSDQQKSSNIFAKVGVVGCGILGQEITRLAAQNGLEVVFIEISEARIKEAFEAFEMVFDSEIDRWGMTESEKKSILSKIKGTTDYQELAGCDIVIESIKSKSREDSIEIRKRIFKNIEEFVSEDTIIATNSTTLVITELSNELDHPERCLSLHFLSPATEANVVEVVRSLYTVDSAYEKVEAFARLLNKKVIPVQESPGVISTRLIAPIINEACSILMEGVGKVEDIDSTMKLGFGFPLGPFEMADKYGLDTVVRWLENLYKEFGNTRYKASPLLKRMVRANRLGRETGQGFYTYDKDGYKIK